MSFSIINTLLCNWKNRFKHYINSKKHVPHDYNKLHLFYSSMFTLFPTMMKKDKRGTWREHLTYGYIEQPICKNIICMVKIWLLFLRQSFLVMMCNNVKCKLDFNDLKSISKQKTSWMPNVVIHIFLYNLSIVVFIISDLYKWKWLMSQFHF